MALPMPLFERFAKGTHWKLACPFGLLPVNTEVEVVKEPYETEESLVVDVVPAEDTSLYGMHTLPLDILA